MEARSIPKPKKSTDKGITEKLRALYGTFSEYFDGVSRRTIYTTARRLGFKAITRTEGEGVRVWRGEPIAIPTVHHKDGNPQNNEISNLDIVEREVYVPLPDSA